MRCFISIWIEKDVSPDSTETKVTLQPLSKAWDGRQRLSVIAAKVQNFQKKAVEKNRKPVILDLTVSWLPLDTYSDIRSVLNDLDGFTQSNPDSICKVRMYTFLWKNLDVNCQNCMNGFWNSVQENPLRSFKRLRPMGLEVVKHACTEAVRISWSRLFDKTFGSIY